MSQAERFVLSNGKLLRKSTSNPITVRFTFLHNQYFLSKLISFSTKKCFLRLELMLGARERTVYIGGCRERNWIIIQIVCITKTLELDASEWVSEWERGVSLCAYTCAQQRWMCGWACFRYSLNPHYIAFSACLSTFYLCSPRVSNSHVPLATLRTTLQNFSLHRPLFSHPQRLKLQCNMTRSGEIFFHSLMFYNWWH